MRRRSRFANTPANAARDSRRAAVPLTLSLPARAPARSRLGPEQLGKRLEESLRGPSPRAFELVDGGCEARGRAACRSPGATRGGKQVERDRSLLGEVAEQLDFLECRSRPVPPVEHR